MLIPAQNLNKANCKIQDYFANRQIKEDVKCNKHYSPNWNIIRGLRITLFSNQNTISERNREREKIDIRIDQT
jgi:hypothetical protein